MSKNIAVIIPCYNEAAGIAEVVRDFPRAKLSERGYRLSVYVVDNNSSDNTADIARKAGATVLHEPKQGKGNALRTGFHSLPDNIDYVVMLDGDNTYSPSEILRMIEPLDSGFCDAVIGSRLSGQISNTAMNQTSRLGNRLFTAAVRLLYRANVSDVLTGYFAWNKSALDALTPHIVSQGFAIEMEMITKMARLGLRLTAVPISYHPRAGESHLHPLRDGYRILVMLIRNLVWRQKRSTKRKIVFVSDAIYPYMKGGKEKRLYQISKNLAAMGNDVHIYTMHWWQDAARTHDEDGVHLHALCKYHEMYRGNRRTIGEGVLFGLACLKLLRVPFDVLDVDHMPFFPIFSMWLVCALRRRKMHATWHEALSHQEWLNYMGPSGAVAGLLERISTRLPHRITAASAHTRERLKAIHGRAKRVELVASGIDTQLINSVSPTPTQCEVLYVGRLVKDKHVEKLITAMKIVTKTLPDTRCVIIGQGLERARLERLTDKKALQQNIRFLDPLPNEEDIYAHMKAARVFCSPSVREGFGIVSLEALACGTPVITVDSPYNAARMLVHNGEDGSVVALSAKAIAAAIIYWLTQDQKPAIVAPTAEYDWRRLAQKQAEVYSL